MENNKSAIQKLEDFKKILHSWEYDKRTSTIRSEINKKISIIRQLVIKAGALKSLTIGPPPAIGGLLMKNVDPFTCIFDPPYRQSVVPILIDCIDEAIGVFETNEEIFKETKDVKNISEKTTKSNRIFIVHGRDNELKETTARFLEKLDLVPVILHEQTNKGKTIIEKFEEYSDVGFAIVLMTPDDIGHILDKKDDWKYRARQNVVFELGYFIGKLGRMNVAAIVKSDIEIPTDINGVVYIGVDNSDAWKLLLAKEIKAAGIEIDLNKLI
jgi:predicted nucleotide-binding protein